MALNSNQFRMHYEPAKYDKEHRIRAYHPSTKKWVGSMVWASQYPDEGPLRNIDVDPEYQRQGVATSMWRFAQQLGQRSSRVPSPIHSTERTPEGDAWARSTGDFVPPNDMSE